MPIKEVLNSTKKSATYASTFSIKSNVKTIETTTKIFGLECKNRGENDFRKLVILCEKMYYLPP